MRNPTKLIPSASYMHLPLASLSALRVLPSSNHVSILFINFWFNFLNRRQRVTYSSWLSHVCSHSYFIMMSWLENSFEANGTCSQRCWMNNLRNGASPSSYSYWQKICNIITQRPIQSWMVVSMITNLIVGTSIKLKLGSSNCWQKWYQLWPPKIKSVLNHWAIEYESKYLTLPSWSHHLDFDVLFCLVLMMFVLSVLPLSSFESSPPLLWSTHLSAQLRTFAWSTSTSHSIGIHSRRQPWGITYWYTTDTL